MVVNLGFCVVIIFYMINKLYLNLLEINYIDCKVLQEEVSRLELSLK